MLRDCASTDIYICLNWIAQTPGTPAQVGRQVRVQSPPATLICRSDSSACERLDDASSGDPDWKEESMMCVGPRRGACGNAPVLQSSYGTEATYPTNNGQTIQIDFQSNY